MPYLDTLRNRKKLDKSAVVLSTKGKTKKKLEECPECNCVGKLYKVIDNSKTKHICTYCKSRYYSKCSICNKYHLDTRPYNDRHRYYERNKFICISCKKDFVICDKCNNEIHISKTFFGSCFNCSDTIISRNQSYQNHHQYIS